MAYINITTRGLCLLFSAMMIDCEQNTVMHVYIILCNINYAHNYTAVPDILLCS